MCRVRIDKYLQDRADPENKVSAVILEQLLAPNEARGHNPPSAHDLNEEALTLLTAGNDTTAHAMILGTYMICNTPEVQIRLNEELRSAFPDMNGSITYERAKNLPYLVGGLYFISFTPFPEDLISFEKFITRALSFECLDHC